MPHNYLKMPKRENESDADYKVRKKAKKAKKKAKKERKEAETAVTATPAIGSQGDGEDRAIVSDAQNDDDSTTKEKITRTKDKTAVVEFTSFSDAPFAKPIQKALQEAGFASPSPIQARAWPVALAGKDLIAVAKTGSGKTLGFLLPIFHQIMANGAVTTNKSKSKAAATATPHCVVLSPTRELAIQIHGECLKFGTAPVQIRAECLYGGTNVGAQIQQLQSSDPHVIVATPGRLCDLLERQALDLSAKCCFCVLDESDRMLDMGFEKQLTQVIKALPAKRQTLLFTATWPKAVRRVAAKFLREGETTEIFVGESGDTAESAGELAANKAVTQTFVEAQDDEKDKKLYDLLC